MKCLFLSLAIFLLTTIFHYERCTAQNVVDETISISVRNDSKFLISKLNLLERDFENIKPHTKTDYVMVKTFFPSFKIDITIQRKPLFGKYQWYHLISYPIDHVGESKITNPKNTIVIRIVKAEERGEVEVETEIIKEVGERHE